MLYIKIEMSDTLVVFNKNTLLIICARWGSRYNG